MKNTRRKEILEMMLQNLEDMKRSDCDAYYLCWILDDLLYFEKITKEEREQMTAYIFKHKPEFGSKLMCPIVKKWYSYIEEDYLHMTKDELIWNEDNYDQRKAWLLLHIQKNTKK